MRTRCHKIIREQRRSQLLLTAPNRLDHFRTNLSAQTTQYLQPIHCVPKRCSLELKLANECFDAQLAAFKARPSVRVWILRVNASKGSHGQIVSSFISEKRVERTRQNHSAKIKKHSFEHPQNSRRYIPPRGTEFVQRTFCVRNQKIIRANNLAELRGFVRELWFTNDSGWQTHTWS